MVLLISWKGREKPGKPSFRQSFQ